jgi:hypothetical protein
LSFWKRRHHHCSFRNAPHGCALTATTGLNVAKHDKVVDLREIWPAEWLGWQEAKGKIVYT